MTVPTLGGDVDRQEPVVAPATGPASFYTEADLEKARQQEKDKLYRRLDSQNGKISTLEEQIRAWQNERDAAEQARLAAEQEAADAQRRQVEEELSVRELLAKREQEWDAKLQQVRQDADRQVALLQKDRELAELQAFITRRVGEERQAIAPQLMDLIDGNTPEEVEASIARMKTKTAEITAQLQDASTQLAAGMRGVSASGHTADGPLDNHPAIHQISNEELGAMPMSQYVKNRDALLGAAATRNGGLFG